MIRCGSAAVLFGASAPAASRLVGDMGAFTLAGLLYLGAALAVLPFLGRTAPSRADVRRSGPRVGIAVVLGGAVGPVLLAAGLGHAPAATSSLLLNLELVFTTLVAAVIFREHLGRPVIAGTALVVGGTVVLGWSGSPELRWGVLLIAGACLCWAIDNSVTASLDELRPAHITLVKGVVAGSVNLAIGIAVSGVAPIWSMVAAVIVGGFGYGASITLWVAGARELGAARGQLVFATAPFVGAALAWSVLGEPVTARELVALAIAVVGVSFVLRSAHEHGHEHAPVEHDHEHAHDDGHHLHEHDSAVSGRHSHGHRHDAVVHRHAHVPDIHHRHDHAA
jgi:drug/metabolite transporter (DMT)-like permease